MIEHVHGALVQAFGKWLVRNRNLAGITKAALLKDEFQKLFLRGAAGAPPVPEGEPPAPVTPESVAGDVRGLPAVWRWIRDHKGSRAPPRLR